ncbi:hypothetical protein Tco_0813959 [Tanacetum coccineum]
MLFTMISWKQERYIDTKPNNEHIYYCLHNPPYKFKWTERTIPVAKGSLETTTEGFMETYKTVLDDIRKQLNAKAETVQIILIGIDNDIYSIVDACPNACEMWKVIERLKQGESINVQNLETKLFWEFVKFTSWDGESLESYYSRFYKIMNELVRNKCDVTNHQVNVQFLLQLQQEWQSSIPLISILQLWEVTPEVNLDSTLKASDNSWIFPLGPLVIVVVVIVVVSSRSNFIVTGRVTNLFTVSALLSTWPIVVIIALGT